MNFEPSDLIDFIHGFTSELVENEKGKEVIDQLAKIIASFYIRLIKHGVPHDAASAICASFSQIGKK